MRKRLLTLLSSCVMSMIMLVGCSHHIVEYADYPDYNAIQYVDINDYKGIALTVSQLSEEPTDEELMEYINSKLPISEVDDVAKKGDTVSIDFVGKIGDKKIVNASAKNFKTVIGSHKLIQGFEDALIGMKKGDTKVLNVSFPFDYSDTSLRNKTVNFTVKMRGVARPKELTSDLVKKMTNGTYSTVEEYKAVEKNTYIEETKAQNKLLAKNELFKQLEGLGTVKEIPKSLLDWYVDSNIINYKHKAEHSNMSFEAYLKSIGMQDEQQLIQVLEDSAKDALSNELKLRAIAEQSDIKISDKEYEQRIVSMSKRFGFNSVEDFEKSYKKSGIINQMILDKTVDFLLENADISVLSVDYKRF